MKYHSNIFTKKFNKLLDIGTSLPIFILQEIKNNKMENKLTTKEITLLKNMIHNHITIQQMSGVNENEMLNNISEKLSDLMIDLYKKV